MVHVRTHKHTDIIESNIVLPFSSSPFHYLDFLSILVDDAGDAPGLDAAAAGLAALAPVRHLPPEKKREKENEKILKR